MDIKDLSEEGLDKLIKGDYSGLSDQDLEIAIDYSKSPAEKATQIVAETPQRLNTGITDAAVALAKKGKELTASAQDTSLKVGQSLIDTPGLIQSGIVKASKKAAEPIAKPIEDYLKFERETFVKPLEDWFYQKQLDYESIAPVEPRLGEDYKQPNKARLYARAYAETAVPWIPESPSQAVTMYLIGKASVPILDPVIKGGIMGIAEFAPRKVLAGLLPIEVAPAEVLAGKMPFNRKNTVDEILADATIHIRRGMDRAGVNTGALPSQYFDKFQDFYARNLVAKILKFPTVGHSYKIRSEFATPVSPITPENLAPYGLIATPETIAQGEQAVVQNTIQGLIKSGISPEVAAVKASNAMDKALESVIGPLSQAVHSAPQEAAPGFPQGALQTPEEAKAPAAPEQPPTQELAPQQPQEMAIPKEVLETPHPKTGKLPQEMTKDEFKRDSQLPVETAGPVHEQILDQAIGEGRPVPPDVLEEHRTTPPEPIETPALPAEVTAPPAKSVEVSQRNLFEAIKDLENRIATAEDSSEIQKMGQELANLRADYFTGYRNLPGWPEEALALRAKIEDAPPGLTQNPWDELHSELAKIGVSLKPGRIDEIMAGMRQELEANPDSKLTTWRMGSVALRQALDRTGISPQDLSGALTKPASGPIIEKEQSNVEPINAEPIANGPGNPRTPTPGQSGAVPALQENGPTAIPNKGTGTADRPGSGEVQEGIPGEGRSDGAGVGLGESRTAERELKNFRITAATDLEPKGKIARFEANLKAIKLLKSIEADGRLATPEEQATLVKYVGWGQLSNAFNRWSEDFTEARYNALKELLTENEYDHAERSTINAHYTSREVIRPIMTALEKLGFRGGRILEPSVGIGHFFGHLPDSAIDSNLIGIDLDDLSARIAKQLYQKADIRSMNYGDVKLPNNFMDLTFTNVPFSKTSPFDVEYNKFRYSLHDYFIVKSLDKTRPGGLGIFITSRYSLDKQDAGWRRAAYEHSDLIYAVRLPDTAFKGNANTEVVTDILFFRKRLPGEAKGDSSWLHTEAMDIRGNSYQVNKYILAHPENVVGKFTSEGSMYAADSLSVNFKGDLEPAIETALANIPENVYSKGGKQVVATLDIEGKGRKGEHIVKEGKVFQRTEAGLVEKKAPAEKVESLLAIRDSFNAAIQAQISDAPLAMIEKSLKNLTSLYDKFYKKYGPINKKENASLLDKDPDLPRLLALESFDDQSESWKKTDFFAKRSLRAKQPLEKAANAKDALGAILNETGKVDIERIAALTGETPENAITALQSEGLVYKNPEGTWETSEKYLSGNVKAKLIAARAAAALEPDTYKANVEALEAVQPVDLEPHEIFVQLGSHWVPANHFEDFFQEITGVYGGGYRRQRPFKISYIDTIGTWTVEVESFARKELAYSTKNTTDWGTEDFSAYELLKLAMQGKDPTVMQGPRDARTVNKEATEAARDKQNQIKERFSTWVFETPDRAKVLAKLYNDIKNNYRVAKYDGSHLTLPGSNPDETLREYQKDGIWQAISSSENYLMGVEVGLGKTYMYTAIAMEARRLGLARKIVINVKNATLGGTVKQFRHLYPSAKLLVLDSTAMDPKERKTTLARAATQDWDAIIMPHSVFGMIPMSVSARQQFYQEQINDIAAAIEAVKREEGKDSGIIKKLQKTKESLEKTFNVLGEEMKKDDALTWEEMGVDMLIVDEAQAYKNLHFFTKKGNVAGITSGSDTKRSFDMFMKTRHTTKMNGGRGVIFATGTPISNSMAEVYTLQRYLQYDKLKAEGEHHFDAWADQYGSIVNSLELTTSGKGMKVRKRFAKFKNVAELMKRYLQFAHIIRHEDLPESDRPIRPKIAGGKTKIVGAEPSPMQKEYIDFLVSRVENLAKKGGALKNPHGWKVPENDNHLVITTDGRKAALDMRLVDPNAEDFEGSKLNLAVQAIYADWKATEKTKGTQLVFSDYGTPSSVNEKFDVYNEIRRKLVALGIPKKEIMFIHEADTEDALKDLFAKMNTGKIRVLIGSSEKMGVGVNITNKGYSILHLDAPWRPDMIEQRNGRFIRWGNENKEVKITQYVTKETFDAYMFQTLEAKARSFEPIVNGQYNIREVDDTSMATLTYEEIKAIASGSPLVIEKIKTEREITRLVGLQMSHKKQIYSSQAELAIIPTQIETIKKKVSEYKEDIEAIKKAEFEKDEKGKEKFKITLEDKVITSREEAGKKLFELNKEITESGVGREIGSFKGFPVHMASGVINVRGKAGSYSSNVSDSATGTLSAMEGKLSPERIEVKVKEQEEQIARLAKREKELGVAVQAKFKQAEDLSNLQARSKEIDSELGLDKDQSEGLPEDGGEGDSEGGGESGTFSARGLPTAAESASELEGVVPEIQKAAPAPLADLSAKEVFASDIPVELGQWDTFKLRPIDLPELVELASSYGVKLNLSKRLRTSAGTFQNIGKGLIKLRPDIFKNPEQAAKVLAHEVGHWIDWFGGPTAPETMKRGNLLGHLLALQGHLKNVFGDASVTNKEARAELIAVSELWRPYDKSIAPDGFKAYRNSSEELYADMISVLFNSPGTLERMAPKTWKAFFEAMDKRPEVRLSLEELWGRMQGEDADVKMNLAKIRHEKIKAMADVKAEAAFKQKMIDKNDRESQIWDRIAQDFQNIYHPILKAQDEARLAGTPIPEELDLKYLTQKAAMLHNDPYLILWGINTKVYLPMQELGISLGDLHAMAFYDRIMGDRADIANPGGHYPTSAKDGYRYMLDHYGYDKVSEMRLALNRFHDIVFEYTLKALDAGVYPAEMRDTLIANRMSYGTFQTLSHIDDYVSPGLSKQIGTLGDINNIIIATAMKTVALSKVTTMTLLKQAYIKTKKQAQPDSISELAPVNPGDKLPKFIAKKTGFGVVEVLENGKRVGYEVPELEARSFEHQFSEYDSVIIHSIRMIHNGVWQKLWLDLNPGWAFFLNPVKDIKQALKAMPDTSIAEFLSMRSNPETVASAEKLARGDVDSLTAEMIKAKAIVAPMSNEMQYNTLGEFITAVKNEFGRRAGGGDKALVGLLRQEEYDQYMTLLGKNGLLQRQNGGSRWPVIGKVVQLMDWLSYSGRKQEALTKIAGYKLLKAHGLSGEELGYQVRTYVGTPPWFVKGKYTTFTNTIFPYSNIALQGYVRDYKQAGGGEGKERQRGWWWKTAKYDLAPKAAMAIAAATALKESFDRMSEYDKTNYICIPLGFQMGGEYGWKVVYARIPHDESSRILSGMMWKIAMMAAGQKTNLTGLFDFTAGQFPNMTPTLSIPAAWAQVMAGHNPYDSFRGRTIIPDRQFKAGGLERTKRMLGWTIDQTGLMQIASYDPARNTTTEHIVRFLPVVNRMIKISDYGMTEKTKGVIAAMDQEDSQAFLSLSDKARQFSTEYSRLSQMKKADTLNEEGQQKLRRMSTFYHNVFTKIRRVIKRDTEEGKVKDVEENQKRLDVMIEGVMKQ